MSDRVAHVRQVAQLSGDAVSDRHRANRVVGQRLVCLATARSAG